MLKTLEDRSRTSRLEDPRLQPIADRVLHTLQLAAEKAVAHLAAPDDYPMPRAGASAEQIFLRRLRQRPARKQHAALTRFQALSAAERQAAYGPLARVDLRSAAPIATQVGAIPSRVRLAPESLPTPKAHVKSGPASTAFAGVRLRLHKMHCVEETTGGGGDEIVLGGLAVDAAGTVHKINAFTVGSDFDTGETKTYTPPRTFAAFDFADSNTMTVNGTTYGIGWPRTFRVTFALAEEDNGGFPEFLQELFEVGKDYVVKEVAAAVGAGVGAAAGAAIGTTVPGLGTAIGAAVGAILGWVMGALFEWLVGWWEDDIFIPLTTGLTLTGPTHRWEGATHSPDQHKWWKGHGGHYKLYFDWQMYGVMNPADDQTLLNVGAVAWHAAQRRDKRIDVFARGDDRRIYQSFETNAGWSGWAPNPGGGTFSTGPAAASWGRNRLDVFAVGDDRRIWHSFWNGGGWSGWGPVGDGTFTSSPAAVSWGPNRLDVFARGDDHRVYHASWNGGGWSAWSPIGDGTFTSGPAAASWGSNRLDVFARGGDHRVYHASWQGSGWSGWAPLGAGTFTSGPAAAAVAVNRLDVFAVGKDRRMWRAAWNGTAWSGWFDDMGNGTFS